MIWIEGIAVGIVVGGVGGLWLLLNLTMIQAALRKGESGLTARISALLTLPAFQGGSTWAAHTALATVIKAEALPDTLLSYFLSSTLVIIAINVIPCIRLVSWCSQNIGPDPR